LLRIVLQFLMELADGLRQGVYLFKVMIMSHSPTQVVPDVLLWIQFRRVARQKLNLELLSMFLQQLADRFGVVSPIVVYEQNHSPLRMTGQVTGPRNSRQQTPEAHVVAPRMKHVNRLTAERVHRAPVPAFLGMYARRQDNSLLADGRPAAANGRKQTQLGRVSEQQQGFRPGLGTHFSDLFFSRPRVADLAYA
jgi:hypothetical protein